jgi:hypothetical protein
MSLPAGVVIHPQRYLDTPERLEVSRRQEERRAAALAEARRFIDYWGAPGPLRDAVQTVTDIAVRVDRVRSLGSTDVADKLERRFARLEKRLRRCVTPRGVTAHDSTQRREATVPAFLVVSRKPAKIVRSNLSSPPPELAIAPVCISRVIADAWPVEMRAVLGVSNLQFSIRIRWRERVLGIHHPRRLHPNFRGP